jgi:CubicO group peptidase (beta-lactamase class C family)
MTANQTFPVSGTVAAGFEPVRAAFEENFTRQKEAGAALHVIIDGQVVVDLWGGAADQAGSRPWTPDTLVNVWSTTKGWLALAMHMLADQGRLDFDAPVACYWPEFAQHGKDGVLVRHVLTHTSGLPAPSVKVPDEALYDWQAMVHAFEDSELFWAPGTQAGYHAASFGWLNGEVLRRITRMTAGQFLRAQIAAPLDADVHIGLCPEEIERAAEIIPPSRLGSTLMRLINIAGGRARKLAFSNPPRPTAAVNTRKCREAEIPSSNGHASARGLARLYNVFALGGQVGEVRLLSAASVERAGQEQIHMKDVVIGMPVRRSLGYMLPDPGDPRPPSAFGHPGMGGSAGFADPHNRLAMGYVMNRMAAGLDPRFTNLCRAVYECVGKR